MPTSERLNKLTKVASFRQFSLRVVLENIHDPHNVSAIFRSCDAVGVPKVSLVYTVEKFPRIGKKSSASAFKWVEKNREPSIPECYQNLKNEGFAIYASSCNPEAKSLYEYDFTGKVAIVMGNEHRGISEEAEKHADHLYFIPMYGMVQSLNVSVAAAVTLYEIARQRSLLGQYSEELSKNEKAQELIAQWSNKR